jgi:hypothetical protein
MVAGGTGAMGAIGVTGVIGATGVEAIGATTVTAVMVIIGRIGALTPTIGLVTTVITPAGTGTAIGAGTDTAQVGTVATEVATGANATSS